MSQPPASQRKQWLQFNVFLVLVGSVLIGLNWLRPYVLQYVHECAKYVHVDIEALVSAFAVIVLLANALYKGLYALMARSTYLKSRSHTALCWALLLAVGWLMVNDLLLNELPTLISDPEVLCD